MPTAVIMEENFDKLLEQCEAQELEVSVGQGHESSLVLVVFYPALPPLVGGLESCW